MSKISQNEEKSLLSILKLIGKWLVLCLLIGILAGSAAAGFLKSLDLVTNFRESHRWLIWLLPIAGFVVGLIYHYYGKEANKGNNLLIEAIDNPKIVIPFRMAPFVYLGTMVTHLFGGSAGREGTALQMSAAISAQLGKLFSLSTEEKKILILVAIAAGFGAVFGTPFAGAIFAIEAFLIGRLKYYTIFPILLAAFLADLITKLWHAHHTTYHIDLIPDFSIINLWYAIGAGLLFALCAAIFSHTLHFVVRIFKSKIQYPPLRPFIGGAIVVLIVWNLDSTKYIGLGIPTIIESFNQPAVNYDFILKMVLTILTVGAGFKGGEVTPLFFIGATLGSALSLFIPLPTALLAGMGFVAVFAGATHAPIACMVMAMELFGVDCGIYVAIACIISYLCSGRLTIYENQLARKSKYAKFSRYFKQDLEEL